MTTAAFHSSPQGYGHLVRVMGEIDVAEAPRFRSALDDLIPDVPLTIDLAGCTFMDSTGLQVLFASLKRFSSVELLNPQRSVKRLLDLVEAHRAFTIRNSQQN
jgi:anti-anti-sigma factor